jgi:type I restriction enzyme S subunit
MGVNTIKYKQTELGLIPNDWQLLQFVDVIEGFSSGQTPYRVHKEFYKGNIPWITSGELNYNIITDTIEKITPEGVKDANLKTIPVGTFLMAITGLEAAGTRGSCAITGVEATTNQSCMALYPIRNKLTTEYLYHFYVHYGNELAFKYCQGTKQQSYTGAIAKTLPIILPPSIKEQIAIANTLSETDALIDGLEDLIAKKKNLKQGALQKLLKPKDGWVKRKLGEVLDYEQPLKYLVSDTDYTSNGQTPVLTVGKTFILGYTDENEGIYYNTPVIIFDDFTTQSRYVDFSFKIKSSAIKLLKPKSDKISLRFVFEAMQHIKYDAIDHKRHWIGEFQAFEIELPNYEIQNEIVDIINDMTNEFENLLCKLSKYKQLKQGMMQNLLTGKIRFI